MVIPNLQHPVPIDVVSLDLANTIQDDDHRETVQQTATTTTLGVPGQVKWYAEEMEIDAGGRKVKATGYILFRYLDLTARSVTLKFNSRFTKIGNITCLVYVVNLAPLGHYPDQGGATMVKAFFHDRQPAAGGFDL